MARVFISHASKDGEEAARLREWLQGRGFESVFLDFDQYDGIPPGGDWERTLYHEIGRADAVLLVFTTNWLASKWCFAEFTQARAVGKAIFPLIQSPAGDTFVAPDIQHLDLRSDRQSGLDRLAAQLTEIALNARGGFEWDRSRPPFPGLLAYDEPDAAIYFGRDDDIRRLIERLNARRAQGGSKLIALLGASGSGKSSLMRAGVLPRLKRDKRNWIVVPSFRPQSSPLDELAQSIAQALGPGIDWRKVREVFTATSLGQSLSELARDLRTAHAANAAHILISIDQGEELFSAPDRSNAEKFWTVLNAMLAEHLPFIVLLGLRSDYLGQLQEVQDLQAPFEDFQLKPLPLERVRDIIEGPARIAKLSIDNALIAEAAKDAATDDSLPLLAFALRELYDRFAKSGGLTIEGYRALGDERAGLSPLENAVRRKADEVLAEARPSPEQLQSLKDAFVPAMVRVNAEGEYVRRPARIETLSAQARPLIERLAKARLLTLRQEESAVVVEVAHEALLRKWPLLRSWLDAEREFLIGRQQLEQDLQDWETAPDAQKSDALLSGLKLTRAREWLIGRPHSLSDSERKFVQASVARHDAETRRRQRLRRRITQGAIAATIVFAVLSVVAGRLFLAAEKQRNDALIAQSQFLARDARAATAQGNATLGALLALAALPVKLSAPDRPFVKEAALALEAAMANQRERLIIPDAGGLNALAVAPNGRAILATAKGNPNRNGWSRTVRIIDIGTGKELTSLSHRLGVYDLHFSSDAARLTSVTLEPDDKKNRWHVQVWDVSTGRELFRLDELENKPQFSSDGRRILLTGDSKANELRDAKTGALIKSWPPKKYFSAQFSPDGKSVLAVASGKDAPQLWSAETGEVIRLLEPIRGYVSAPRQAFSPDGSIVVIKVDNFSGEAKLFDTRTGADAGSFRAQAQEWRDVVLSPDNSRAVTWGSFANRNAAQLLDARTGAVIASFKHAKEITSAAFSNDGSRIVTVSDDQVLLWDSAQGAEIVSLRSHSPDDNTASLRHETVARFSPASDRLLVSFEAASTQLLDSQTGAQIARLTGVARSISEQYEVNTVGYAQAVGESAFSADKRLVTTVDETHAAHIWNLANGRPLSTLFDGGATTASFSPDGNRVVTFGRAIGIWHLEPLTVEAFRGHAGAVNSATLSRDGKLLATADADKTVRIWDTNKHAEVTVLRGHEAEVHSVAFSPDGESIVTASADKTARVWNARDGATVLVLRGHTNTVRSAVFSPDGKRIVTASDDKTVRLWDAATGNSIRIFPENARPVYSAVFSPDARNILSAADGSLVIFDVETGKEVKALRQKYDRNSNDRSDRARAEALGQLIRSQDGVKRPFAYYSADGFRIVGVLAGAVELWDAASGLPNWAIFDRNTTWSAKFSPDGRYVATAADDGAVRLWSEKHWSSSGDGTISDDPVVTLAVNNGRMNSVEFSSTGDRIVSASDDGAARIWNVAHCQTLIDRARKQLPRELSKDERKQHYLAGQSSSTGLDLVAVIRPYLTFLVSVPSESCN